MRHVGKITYYNSEKKYAYIDENGTTYALSTKTCQLLADPDSLLKKGNTIFFSVNPNKTSAKYPYVQNITRVVPRHSPRVERTAGEKRLLEIFRSSNWLSDWTILEQPHINGLKPDFILIHPRKGAVIIEVKDWNLNDTARYQDGKVLGNDGEYHDADPAYQLNRYSTCLTGLNFLEPDGFQAHIWNTFRTMVHLENDTAVKAQALNSYPFWEKVVFFSRPDITLEQARKFCPNSQCVWTLKEAEYLLDPNHKFSDCSEFPWALRLFGYGKVPSATKYYSAAPNSEDGKNIFMEYLRRITCWLDGTDYEKSREKPYQLTQAQLAQARHTPGECRACEGVAGSGKSLILAQKAADAISENRRVLVLCYNITLLNYLRDLCRQQFTGDSAEFNQWLTLDYFHGVLRDALHDRNLSVKVDDSATEEKSAKEHDLNIQKYIQEAIQKIYQNSTPSDVTEYDDVLVDEGDDFRDYEIAFLKNVIYNGKGEFLIMHDPAQRIYSELSLSGLWGDDPAALGLTKSTLKETYCLPPKVKDLLDRVRETFHIPGLPMEMEPSAASHSSYGSVQWLDFQPARYAETMLSELSYWLKNKGVHPEDLILVTVDYHSAEKLSGILEAAGIPVQLCERTRDSKRKFWAGKNNLKIATYHNFKGWHAPYVILVLDSGLAAQEELQYSAVLNAFYVALSRVNPTTDTHSYCFRCLNFLTDERLQTLAALTNGN